MWPAERLQDAFESGKLLLGQLEILAIPLSGLVYEITPRPTQSDFSHLAIGTYSISEIVGTAAGTLPVFTKPVSIEILG